jgi:D-amino-acid dehydrogenase
VIIANGSWSGKLMRKSGYRLPMQDGKGYSMTISNLSGQPSIPALLHEARVAVTPMGDQLRVSGTLEISGMDDQVKKQKVNSIVKAVSSYYPDIQLNDAEKVWYGYRPCTPDGMPYVGRWKEGSAIIVATGHAMMGLSLAPSTGRMVKELVMSIKRPHFMLAPNRFS